MQAKTERLAGSTKALVLGLLLAALVSISLMLVARPAHAAKTYTVNSTFDLPDMKVGDGVCDVITSAGNQCGLRAAIQEANHPNSPGADVINFNINSGGRVATIRPNSPLPVITEAVTINGYSQPGAAENTQLVGTDARLLIELDGTNSRSTGLIVRASDVEVQGLVINNFFFGGISVNNGASNAKIEGNFIGTDPSGTENRGNGGNGVSVSFGGTNNVVGGAPRTAHNLISGNDFGGVEIQGSSGNKVLGNLIGTKKDGTTALGNGAAGVRILEAADNTVGTVTFGTANTIAFNGEDGVEVRRSNPSADVSGNRIQFNSIFSNGRLGINLRGGTENAAGATANDTKDPDEGANDLQNKPVLDSAKTVGGKTTVQGRLNSTSRDPFVVEFYSNPSGNEGKKFLGNKAVSTDSNGNATFTFTPSQAVPAGQRITATVTNAVTGDTSEFSGPRIVAAQ